MLRLLDKAPPNREGFFLPGTHSTARNDSAKVVDSFRDAGNGVEAGTASDSPASSLSRMRR